jgi:hypothetical protein
LNSPDSNPALIRLYPTWASLIISLNNVEDEGEAPAYTMGYLVGRMWEVFSQNI